MIRLPYEVMEVISIVAIVANIAFLFCLNILETRFNNLVHSIDILFDANITLAERQSVYAKILETLVEEGCGNCVK